MRAAQFLLTEKQASREIAGRPAALPRNCLTTGGESRTILAFRPRHFSNFFACLYLFWLQLFSPSPQPNWEQLHLIHLLG